MQDALTQVVELEVLDHRHAGGFALDGQRQEGVASGSAAQQALDFSLLNGEFGCVLAACIKHGGHLSLGPHLLGGAFSSAFAADCRKGYLFHGC